MPIAAAPTMTKPHRAPSVDDAPLPSGPHLLDVSMFWDAGSGVRRLLSGKHAVMMEQGWRHTLLAPGLRQAGQIDCGGVALPRTGGYRWVLGRGSVERLIEQVAPDIIEAADPYVMPWATLAAGQRLHVPAVACCLSNLPALAARRVGGHQGLSTRRGRWAARHARNYLVELYAGFDLVLAPSQGLVHLLHHWGVRNAVHQPLGIDTAVFTPAANDRQWRMRLCEHLGLRRATRLLVYSGRFAPEKNLPLLAQAVELLGPDFALLAVGAGPCPPRGPNVRVLKPEADDLRLARLLASCDAYVHAGDQEPVCLGALEAMACGTPVVVPSTGALAELAQDVGMTVDRGTARDWAEAIGATVAARASSLAFRALERARRHDWTRVVGPMSQRYRRLLGRGAVAAAVPRHDLES